MEEVSRKLEVMLSKLQKMNINMLGLWFPSIDKEDILKALRESNKFKFEGDYVRIKTYEEIYEEELQAKLENEKKNIEKESKVGEDAEGESNRVNVIVKEPIIDGEEKTKFRKISFDKEIIIHEKPIDIKNINGAEIEYDHMVRIIEEYNKAINEKMEKADGNSFEAKTNAIIEFYETKYVLKKEDIEENELDIEIHSLTNKKKNLESGYVVICNILNKDIVDYILDNYTDEVVYFCPIEGATEEFEFDLNEFFIKDTKKIFMKYLKKCVVVEEKEMKIQRVQVITGF